MVVAGKQDVDRIDLPFEEIEATVSFFSVNIVVGFTLFCSVSV